MKDGNEVKSREWQTPKFERQDLKDALAGGPNPSLVDAGGYS